MQYKYVKIGFKHFSLIGRNASKTFVCLCRRTNSRMHSIFNTVRTMSDMNNIYEFQDIGRIVMKVRACTDG